MAKFCSNCGKEVNENADVCLKCGVMIKKDNIESSNNLNYNQNITPKVRVPGKGMSIAGMVLGIVAVSWVFIKLLQIGNIERDLSLNIFSYYTSSAIIGYAIGYTIFSLVPSIIGLVLSTLGMKKHKSNSNVAGVLLNIIALAISVIYFIYILSFL